MCPVRHAPARYVRPSVPPRAFTGLIDDEKKVLKTEKNKSITVRKRDIYIHRIGITSDYILANNRELIT